jgi:hypothetical protein
MAKNRRAARTILELRANRLNLFQFDICAQVEGGSTMRENVTVQVLKIPNDDCAKVVERSSDCKVSQL